MKVGLVREHDQKQCHQHNHAPRQVPSSTQFPLGPGIRNHEPLTLARKLGGEDQDNGEEQEEELQVKHRVVYLFLEVNVRREQEKQRNDSEYGEER
ncbi:hypothetical protein GQ457_16G013030 [Hibiscus cannabinus]